MKKITKILLGAIAGITAGGYVVKEVIRMQKKADENQIVIKTGNEEYREMDAIINEED